MRKDADEKKNENEKAYTTSLCSHSERKLPALQSYSEARRLIVPILIAAQKLLNIIQLHHTMFAVFLYQSSYCTHWCAWCICQPKRYYFPLEAVFRSEDRFFSIIVS
jgi:hypothetical protein